MRKKKKGLVALLLSLLLAILLLPTTGLTVEAAAKPKLAKKSSSIVIGGTSQIKVKNAPKGAKITYKSAKKSIATVSKKGKVKGIKSGTTKITVSVKKNSKTTKLTYKITMKKPKLSKSTLSLISGETVKLSVKNKPKKAKYTWTSSNSKVATVSKTGKVTAKSKGTATVKVKVKTAKKTYSLSSKVTVSSSSDKEQTYTVKFNSNGGSSVASQTVKKNVHITKPADPTRDGYVFKGWYTTASGGQKFNFNTAITGDMILYAHWTPVATDYYENNAELIKTIDAEKSDDVLAEKDVKSLLENKGFGENPISYDYSISGNRVDDTNIEDDSTDEHPMYQTLYMSRNGEVWAIYAINGSIFANPISFNLESDLKAQLLVSESETLTSYDDATNQFYVTKPHSSEVIVHKVSKIDSETLDRLTIQEICNLSGASFSEFTNEDDYNGESEIMFASDTSSGLTTTATTVGYSNDNPLIIVSLGDSYSSGEGIPKFYGQDLAWTEKVKNEDWLAHRSTKSWPSLLKVPGVDGTMADYRVPLGTTSDASIRWYFAAASGAETKHLQDSFHKEYHHSYGPFTEPLDGHKNLPPQLDVFDNIRGDVDYVTLSIGGNDVGFADVVTTCAVNCTYLHFGATSKLEDQLNDAWDNFYITRSNIRNAYENIKSAAGVQASIIVAGYPQLLEPNGKGFVINKKEAELVNNNVSRFNDEIESIVNGCRNSGMDIYFVDVEPEFSGHQAYSSSSYLNKIIFSKQSEDLDNTGFGSAYSVHPNEKGAQAYAKLVNAKIKEIENNKANQIRIVLTWGSSPDDLDSHLVGPNSEGDRFHVYYANESYKDEVDLDVDEIDGYGKETIMIRKLNKGIYTYAVHNYSDRYDSYSTSLSTSEAQVKVYCGTELINTYNVPNDKGGTLWTVFSYDSNSQRFSTINEMSYSSSSSVDVLQGTSYARSISSDEDTDIGIAKDLILSDIDANDKYSETGGKTTVVANQTAEVEATNKYSEEKVTDEKGSLKVTMNFSGDRSAMDLSDKEKVAITFTVTGKDYEATFTYADMENDEYTLTNLVPGEYTVEETNGNADGYIWLATYRVGDETPTFDKGTVKVEKDAAAEVHVTNNYTEVYEEED